MTLLVAILLSLQLLDILTTLWVMLRQSGREANPLLAKLMDKIGVVPALAVMKGAFAIGLLFYHQEIPDFLLFVLTSIYVFIVVQNTIVIIRYSDSD